MFIYRYHNFSSLLIYWRWQTVFEDEHPEIFGDSFACSGCSHRKEGKKRP